MRILFCSIVWMKKYAGITDNDKPKYYGVPLSEQEAANDIFNFSEYNGKCYGYVRNESGIILPSRLIKEFENDSRQNPEMDFEQDARTEGVLVVWCAFKDKNSARIVGWYKNAVMFQKEQYQPSFTNPEYELDYYFAADSKDCYLLPENQRVFKMESVSKAGKGKGFGRSDIWFADSSYGQKKLIPEVLAFIESYKGPRANFVLTEEMVSALPEQIPAEQREQFIQKGLQCFEESDYLMAVAWFNAARKSKQTPETQYYLASCLYQLTAFDRARILLEESLAESPDRFSVIELLALCCDMTGDWDNAIKYLEKMISLTEETAAIDVIRNTLADMQEYLDGKRV